jgi:hypothetical protein
MRGFSIDGSPGMGTTPATFVKNIYKLSASTAARDVTVLEAEGFTGGASEYLRSSKGVAASWVFKNAHDATGFLRSTFARAETALPKGSTIHPLEVGVGGAHAFSASSGKVSRATTTWRLDAACSSSATRSRVLPPRRTRRWWWPRAPCTDVPGQSAVRATAGRR